MFKLGSVKFFDPKKLILLSFFDGIGTSPFIIQAMVGTPRLALAWEIDEDCLKVSQVQAPFLVQRGDILTEHMQSVAQCIKDSDPDGECFVLITAGPPCPDFSTITNKADGRFHSEGSKFVVLCDKVAELEALLPEQKFGLVVENVAMADDADTLHFSQALKAQPVLVDGADRGAVSRPRLWWTRLDWAATRFNPLTGEPLKWSQQNQHRRLRLGLPPLPLQTLETRGFSLHPDVLEGNRKVPCFTTPAPEPGGRPAPARQKGKLDADTKQRWLQGGREFAPWQYSPAAMAKHQGELKVMPPHLKEQLHEYPIDYTKVTGVSEKARHRLLANSWHVSAAAFVIALVLQAAAAEAPPTIPSVTRQLLWF